MPDETLINAPADTAGPDAAAKAGGNDVQAPAADQKDPADAASGGASKSDQAPTGAPEKYEFKPPDGVSFDDAVIGAFSEVAKDLNLTQDQAQKVLDKMAPVIAARPAEQVQAARTEWAAASRADKEFGGDKLAENLGTAKKALETFASPELRALLDESGLGNHPEVIRMFYRAGKAISEDRFVGGKAAAGAEKDARRFFPNSNHSA